MRARTMLVRAFGPLALAAVITAGLTGCGSDDGEKDSAQAATTSAASGVDQVGGAPTTAPAASTTAAPAATSHAPAKPLTCAQLREAEIENASVKLGDYPFDSIRLTDGRWAAEDGTTILLQKACGIGDLTGDVSQDAVGVVQIDGGGTGKFWVLVAWRNRSGSPVLAATAGLGDRTPVTSISISGQKATVVYYTRQDDEPMAVLSIKRTAIFKLSDGTLTEISHTDEPYSG